MLPIAILLTLLGGAVAIMISQNAHRAKMLALGSGGLAFILSAVMVAFAGGEHIRVVVGGPPWNFYLYVTPLSTFMVCLFVGVGLLIIWASLSMIESEVAPERIHIYYALVCVLIATLCGVVILNNFINIFIMMELSSFAAVGLIIIKNKPENMHAGLRYLTLSIFGSAFILMGIVVLHSLTGALSINGIRESLEFVGNEYQVRSAVIFFTIGIALKSGLFPLHIAVPDAYESAPSPSSALLSGLVQKAYIFVYIVILHGAIGTQWMHSDPVLSLVLFLVMITGGAAIIAGSAMALLQPGLKRMIAYSSIGQVGYLFMGIGLGSQLGLLAVMFHFLAHAISKSMLFLVAGGTAMQTQNTSIEKMVGLGRKMRVSMAVFTLGALSMIGIPLLVGFNSKWFFAIGIMDSRYIWLLIALGLSSMLNACYYLPITVRGFFNPTSDEEEIKATERPRRHLAPVLVLAALIIVLAAFGAPIVNYLQAGIGNI